MDDFYTLTSADKQWRYERIRAFITQEQLDCILLAGNPWMEENIRYITGEYFLIGFGFAYALFPQTGEPLVFAFPPERPFNLRSVERFASDYWFERRQLRLAEPREIVRAIRQAGGKQAKVGLDMALLGADLYAALRAELPDVDFTDISNDFTALRRVKSAGEIALCREASLACDAVWASMREFLRPGLYDYEIAAEWARQLYQRKADKVFSLMTIDKQDVAACVWPRFHHPVALRRGDMITMEITCSVGGYWAQRVGCASLGVPAALLREMYAANQAAQEKAAALAKPGASTADLARAMDEVLAECGFLSNSGFPTGPHGHMMGLALDEGTITPAREIVLAAGQVFVLHAGAAVPGYTLGQPSVFSPGNMYVTTEHGCEPLSARESELMIIE
ncbi:MAG: M24 family metallopeptidase [Gracilibacteraceae bacterium]|jgi:Xaa-Pro aminopeptidase|nr:M24 family metallopeptidase [Gracilibacteraceae bacterium]